MNQENFSGIDGIHFISAKEGEVNKRENTSGYSNDLRVKNCCYCKNF